MRQGWHGIPYWAPGWRTAAVAGVVLVAGALLAGRSARPRVRSVAGFAREVGVVAALFAAWQFAGHLGLQRVVDAGAHGRWVWHAERVLHLPSEASFQSDLLPHHTLMQALNGYYAVAHLTGMGLFLLWVIAWHRHAFGWTRNVLVMLTASALVVQTAVAVAPPRLLPGLGVVDAPALYHQSVYGPVGAGLSDQVAAMPSLHVGWAALVAVAGIRATRSRWRWLFLLHPALTVVAVVVTGNHYWFDGIAAVILLAAAVAVQWAWDRRRRGVADPVAAAEQAPVASAV